MPQAQTRFDPDQARRFWEHFSHAGGDVDFSQDPDGLGNACYPGAPILVNRYQAGQQKRVFRELLTLAGPPRGDRRALDVGWAARWCRILAERGYHVTGIDLQSGLIERNRRVMPEARFHRCAIQDFEDHGRFELATSVTVLQHIPFAEQPAAVARIRSLLHEGGHALLLENVVDQGVHAFSRPVDGWLELVSRAGLEAVAMRPYDWNPLFHLLERVHGAVARAMNGNLPRPESYLAPKPGSRGSRRLARRAFRGAQLAVIPVDSLLEAAFGALRRPRPDAYHRGFLVRAA